MLFGAIILGILVEVAAAGLFLEASTLQPLTHANMEWTQLSALAIKYTTKAITTCF